MQREFKSAAPLTGLKAVIGRKMANKYRDIKNVQHKQDPNYDAPLPSKTEPKASGTALGSIVNLVMAAKLAKCKLEDPR